MSVLPAVSLALLLSMGACAADDGLESSDEKADLTEVIEWRVPDAPTPIELDEATSAGSNAQSIAYGHCDAPDVEDNGDINISCDAKWSELAWFNIPREEAQRLMSEGHSRLNLQIAIQDSSLADDTLRFSVHKVHEDGSKRKIVSESNLANGESASVDLDDSEFNVYVARGENTFLVWNSGAIEFQLTTTAN